MKSFQLLFTCVLFCNLCNYALTDGILNSATDLLNGSPKVKVTASYCLSGGNDCLILLVCKYRVKFIKVDPKVPKAVCVQGAVTLNLTSLLNPQLTFYQTKVSTPDDKECECLACGKTCSAIGSEGKKSSKQAGNILSQNPLTDLKLSEFVIQANSCITESPGYNCLFLKACNLRALGIKQNNLPTICSDGSTSISYTSTLDLSKPSSVLQLGLGPVRLYQPKTKTGVCKCSENSCNKKCVSNPLSP